MEGVLASDRVYASWFPRSTARYISWELSLAYPYHTQATSASVETVFYRADGTIYAELEQEFRLAPDWTSSSHSAGWGQETPGQWPEGPYRVVLSVAGEEIASGWFEVADDSVFSLGSTSTSSLPESVQQVGQLLPWITDSNSNSEKRALVALSRIAVQDPALAAEVAAFGWVQDGIVSGEAGALEHLAQLASRDPSLIAAVAMLSWTGDGIAGQEWAALRQLALMSGHDPTLTRAVLSFPWVRDDISDGEQGALSHLAALARDNPPLATKVANFLWTADGITADEELALRFLSGLTEQAVSLGDIVGDFLWLLDGIVELEWKSLGNLRDLTIRDHALGRTVASFPWVKDNISDTEWRILGNLAPISELNTAVAKAVSNFSWLADGVAASELQAIRNLRSIATRDVSLASTIVSMPFLSESFEERDEHALWSILNLSDSPEDLEQLTGTAWFADGIDHQEAALVTGLYRQFQVAPEEFRSLLDFHEYQSKSISLPLAGDVQLTILRLFPESALKAQGQIDRLENAVRHIEGFLGVPFPQRDILLLYAETGSQTTGVHLGSHMVVDRPVAIQGDLRRVEAHEVAHYYWGSTLVPLWFREGGSDFLASYVVEQVYGDSLRGRFTDVGGRNARTCNSLGMGTIQKLLDNLAIIGYQEQSGRPYFTCNYVLGEALFLELYENTGPAAFRDLWKEIYLTSESSGREYSEEDIYQLYFDATSAGGVSTFKQIYSTWHGGSFPG